MQKLITAAFSALSLTCLSASAFAFSGEPIPSGPGVQGQFSDPDDAVESIANGAAGGGGRTEISNGDQVPSGATSAETVPATPEDAEPVNPGWPAWMVWHQQ
jgi:hypothetical protein